MKKRSRPLLMAGASSLLFIFISLCLFTLSVLSLVSARADFQLSKKIAERTSVYYQAANEANQTLSRLDETLSLLFSKNPTEKAYFSSLSQVLEGFQEEAKTFSFSVPIQEGQELFVQLQFSFPSSLEEPLYSIIQWKTIQTADWNPDTKQDVYLYPQTETED